MNNTNASIDIDFLFEYSKKKFDIYEQPHFENNLNYHYCHYQYYYYCCYYYYCYHHIDNTHEKITQF